MIQPLWVGVEDLHRLSVLSALDDLSLTVDKASRPMRARARPPPARPPDPCALPFPPSLSLPLPLHLLPPSSLAPPHPPTHHTPTTPRHPTQLTGSTRDWGAGVARLTRLSFAARQEAAVLHSELLAGLTQVGGWWVRRWVGVWGGGAALGAACRAGAGVCVCV